MSDDATAPLRRLLLVLLLIGLAGSATELVLLKHYENGWMLVPFVAIVVALVAAVWRLVRPGSGSVMGLQLAMLPLIVGGGLGMLLHYNGGLEFQVDMDPTLSRWQLFWKVVHMQAPPALAPGLLVQLGLLGLISTYRDPLGHRSLVTGSSAVHLSSPE
ncbi:MAG: hypothetical protein ABIX28_12550 [Vicinamibacterales bacterium]